MKKIQSRVALVVLAGVLLNACEHIPVSGLDCIVYGDTSAPCTIWRAEEEIARKQQTPPTNKELAAMAAIAVGASLVNQYYFKTQTGLSLGRRF